MTTLVKDTHKLITFLQNSGYSKQQAEGMTEAIETFDLSELATKEDIKDLKLDIKDLKLDVYKALAAQIVVIIGVIVTLFQYIR